MSTYDYRITEVVRVVDGDTVDLRIDLGFHMSAALRFRLYGIDTPEKGTPDWDKATQFTANWLSAASNLTTLRARTYKSDSFGRWLAVVYIIDSKGQEVVLNTALLSAGLAVVFTK